LSGGKELSKTPYPMKWGEKRGVIKVTDFRQRKKEVTTEIASHGDQKNGLVIKGDADLDR